MIVGRRMTRNPRTVAPGDPVVHAADILRESGIGHLPVVDGGRLVGILSDTDLRNAMLTSDAAGGDRRVGDVMNREVWSLSPGDSLDDALLVFTQRKFGALPVLSGDKLVGIVTKVDLLRAFADILNVNEACFCVDVSLPRALARMEELYAALAEIGVEAHSCIIAPQPDERDRAVVHLRLATIDGPAVRKALGARGFVVIE